MLIRMLIVDDEPYIADSLSQYIRLHDLPDGLSALEVTATYSGVQALELLSSNKYDILLTDINMPGITGLELAEKMCENWPKCKVIFLTGYEDFSFAQKAIRLNVCDYVLKSEDNAKVLAAVDRAVASIKEEIRVAAVEMLPPELWESARPVLLQDMLRELLAGGLHEEERLLQSLGYPMDPTRRVFPLLCRLARDGASDFLQRQEMLYSIENAVRSYLNKQCKAFFFTSARGELMGLIQPAQASDESNRKMLVHTLELTLDVCAAGGLHVHMVLNRNPIFLHDLCRFYQNAPLLEEMAGLDHSGILLYHFDLAERTPFPIGAVAEHFDFPLKNMGEAIQNGNEEAFFSALQQLRELYNRMENADHYGQVLYRRLCGLLLERAAANGWRGAISGLDLPRYSKLNGWPEAMQKVEAAARQLFQGLKQSANLHSEGIVIKIKHYIAENLHREIWLDDIADHLNFNASYLSRVFSQTTGGGLQKYINRAKMDKACELLLYTDLKVADVMEACGFSNPSYFSKLFKAAMGTSPSEYRTVGERLQTGS